MTKKHPMASSHPLAVITGGTGLIGRRLAGLLVEHGWRVHILTRSPQKHVSTERIAYYAWDWKRRKADLRAFDGLKALVHLAGANIGAKRWTPAYRAEMAGSRILSLRFLRQLLLENKWHPEVFAGASAIGYYGCVTDNEPRTETSPPGKDFLASLTLAWEEESRKMENLARRTVLLRTGVVWDRQSGALPKMIRPVRWGLTLIPGSGRQWISWIHILDIARMYVWALENEVSGTFNAVAPHPLTYREWLKTAARLLHRPCCGPPLPARLLQILMGPSACLALEGVPVSARKLIERGFDFRFPRPADALKDLLDL